MRIALTHPTCWPEVRRGSERLLADLGRVLSARGHEVVAVSTAPDRAGQQRRGDVLEVLLPRRLPPPLLVRTRQFTFIHGFAWDLRRFLLTERFDAVFCLHWLDAAGALAARRAGARFRLVLALTGIPVRAYFRRTPLDRLLFTQVVRRTEGLFVISRFAQDRLRAEFGREAPVLPTGVETSAFASLERPPPDGITRILFVGDADEPRKGAVLLARAYAAARPRLGAAARLGYSGHMSATTREAVLAALPEALRAEVEFHGLGEVGDLPRLMARASSVANPAVWEALGMVLIEALAAGTPVVGCAHAGTLDILDDPRIGTLFDPGPFRRVATNVAGLAEALVRSAALAADPATAGRCRARAEAFSWSVLAPRYEAMLGLEGEGTDAMVR